MSPTAFHVFIEITSIRLQLKMLFSTYPALTSKDDDNIIALTRSALKVPILLHHSNFEMLIPKLKVPTYIGRLEYKETLVQVRQSVHDSQKWQGREGHTKQKE